MKFKLKPVHLFLGLLAVLVLSGLGYGVREYFENNEDVTGSTTAQGINRSEIPAGDEDLYILKSQVVPPVCPKCPDVKACGKPKKCPPCPPCGRCPESPFTCKKVPNYAAINAHDQDIVPRPVLNDFSQFGI